MVTRRARVLASLALVSLCGCSHEPPKADVETPTLAQRLAPLSSAQQLAMLRPLAVADSTDADVAFHVGNAYYGLGSALGPEEHDHAVAYFDSAVAEYRRAVKVDSTLSKAWVNMGLAFEAKGSNADARGALMRAIEVNPRDVLAYCHLGYLEQQNGNVAEGVRYYRQALTIDPNSAQAHYNLGLAFAEARVFGEALLEWQTVAKLDPDGELGRTATENVKIIRQYMDTKP